MVRQPERLPWLALLPVLATFVFYILPQSFQKYTIAQFVPQILAYFGLIIWTQFNTHPFQGLGFTPHHFFSGLGIGSVIGLALGVCNTTVILLLVPTLGGDIEFLKHTPHAQVPTLLMIPWTILLIAVCVEVNFRGFLLGRLVTMLNDQSGRLYSRGSGRRSWGSLVAIGTSALVFAFDPFMVNTFQHLHWIAIWDGLIWGWMWVNNRNLYSVITAHAVEVIILYLSIKAALI